MNEQTIAKIAAAVAVERLLEKLAYRSPYTSIPLTLSDQKPYQRLGRQQVHLAKALRDRHFDRDDWGPLGRDHWYDIPEYTKSLRIRASRDADIALKKPTKLDRSKTTKERPGVSGTGAFPNK